MMYKNKNASGKSRRSGKLTAVLIAAALISALAIGGTIAWLTDTTDGIANTFNPSAVTCEVTETFNGTHKSNVNVKNTGDAEAYIRVKLVTYRTNGDGQHIGGAAELPSFTLGKNWVEYGGCYYYTLPVAPGEKPAANLTDRINLTDGYTDADGGYQSIDVMAEAIQSTPAKAVGEAWNVSITEGSVTAYSGN